MEETILNFFRLYPAYAVVISLLAGLAIAISGILPSYFLTAANISFFGVINGTLLSFLSEAMGAWIAFLLYRKGFRTSINKTLTKYPKVARLINSGDKESFRLVFLFRVIPFIPSGLVTMAAAAGRIKTFPFVLASSIGKIPAIILEALAMYGILQSGKTAGYIIGALAVIFAITLVWKIIGKKD